MSYDSFSEREAAESTDDTTNHSASPLLTPSTSSSHSWLAGKRGAAIGLGAGILIGLAGAATTGIFSGAAKRPAANTPTATAGSAQSVTVASAEPSRVIYAIDTTGTVAAFDMLPVLPQRTGLQIQQVLVAEGDLVKAGQALAVLDDSVLRAELSQA
ncbi:MAG TPA: biotin/lipoyl-binding protein, partial [Candidatus Obscuribacterales bacterium]